MARLRMFLRICSLLFIAWTSAAAVPSYRRVVVLSPAAAEVIHALGAGELVVGKTRTVELFPHAVIVGTHIRSNVEIIATLRPDLVVVSSEKFFSCEIAKSMGADCYFYDPRTLNDVLVEIGRLGRMLAKETVAARIKDRLKRVLESVEMPAVKPKVVYEVMQRPLMLAGKDNIVADIIEHAGGIYALSFHRKFVRTSCERVRLMKPDVYIYQVGPMNRNLEPPEKRTCYRGLDMKVLKVKETEFARAGIRSFEKLLWLNRIFLEWARAQR